MCLQEKKPSAPELDMDATGSHSKADQKEAVLPPGQIKQQLQLLQEAQAENARLRSFMQQYMATSDKVRPHAYHHMCDVSSCPCTFIARPGMLT